MPKYYAKDLICIFIYIKQTSHEVDATLQTRKLRLREVK